MSYTKITAHIVDQSLQLTNIPLLASGGIEEIKIFCDFCPLWDGYGKAAVFYRKGGKVYHAALVDNAAVVPWEVMVEEGIVYFGIMGVAANTRTTEVVELHIDKGAITVADAESSNPPPDLYGQILAALAVDQTRISRLIAMKSVNGAAVHNLSDEYINGKIHTNGASAYIRFDITQMSLVGGGHHFSDYCILPELAPLGPVEVKTSNPDINVTIEAPHPEHGWSRILIENVGNAMYTTDETTFCEAYYPLASVSISELADLRIGYDGQEHGTAGDAVRKQISDLIGYPGEVPAANIPEMAEIMAMYNTMMRDLAAHIANKNNPHEVNAEQLVLAGYMAPATVE